MRKFTFMLPDKVSIGDLSELLTLAVEFKMEIVPDPDSPKLHRKHHVNRRQTTDQLVLTHYTPEGMFTKSNAQDWLEKASYSRTSASPVLSQLKQKGFIKEISPQKYKWLKGA